MAELRLINWTTASASVGRTLFDTTRLRPDELRWFQDHACPPNVIGANYYVTSERFLDTNIGRYPVSAHGGNGRHCYADVEACRYRPEGMEGLRVLLPELWERYRLRSRLPRCISAGLARRKYGGCSTRGKRHRNFAPSGVDLRAHNHLGSARLVRLVQSVDPRRGVLRIGAFDVRGPSHAPTAIAQAVRSLAKQQDFAHPAIPSAGWWQPQSRETLSSATVSAATMRRVPILIAGGRGTLGSILRSLLCSRHRLRGAIATGTSISPAARRLTRHSSAFGPGC